MLRILNVNDMLDLKTGGGTAERTFQMSRYLAKHGASCKVLTIDSKYLDEERIEALNPASVTILPSLWGRFNLPRNAWGAIRRLVNEADVIHLMGHWSTLNALVYLAARRANKPYAVCPAGALPLFGRSRFLKRIYNYFVGNAIIRNASAWIAVTEGEFSHFESYGIPSSKVVVIPNGVCEEDFPLVDRAAFLARFGLPDAPLILFMGRLNLIKGPDLLLQAFIQARDKHPEYHLVLTGPDGGMLSELTRMAEAASVSGFVHFLGYVSGADKSAAYRSAKLLVVPSRSEAMSIVAIEAGICGIPVLLTDQCGFGEIRTLDERMEVSATAKGLADGLSKVLADTERLGRFAPVWKDYVSSRFAWDKLVIRYLNLYRIVLLTGSKK